MVAGVGALRKNGHGQRRNYQGTTLFHPIE